MAEQKNPPNFVNCRVIILSGRYAGQEGVCVGRSADGERWVISPDDTNDIVQLVFEKEFGLLMDESGDSTQN